MASKPSGTKPGQQAGDGFWTSEMKEKAVFLKRNVEKARQWFLDTYSKKDDDKWMVSSGDASKGPVEDPDYNDALGVLFTSLEYWVSIPVGTELDWATVKLWKNADAEFREKMANMREKIKTRKGSNAHFYTSDMDERLGASVNLVMTEFTNMLPNGPKDK